MDGNAGQYEVRWPEIESLTETEQAEVADKWSRLNQQAKTVVVTGAEIRDRVLRLDKLDDADIEEEQQAIKANTPPPPQPGTQPGQPPPNPPPPPQENDQGKASAQPPRAGGAAGAGGPSTKSPTATGPS